MGQCRAVTVLAVILPLSVMASPLMTSPGWITFGSTRAEGAGLYSIDLATGEQTLSFPAVPNGTWSPDGARVAFSKRDERDRSDIYAMDADGTQRRNLTQHPESDTSPVWSPDGSQIAFVSTRHDGHSKDVFAMNADGTNVRNLTRLPTLDMQPDWSPDGTRIAFTSVRDRFAGGDAVAEIYTMEPDGSDQRRLTHHNANDSGPAWSPDGREILILRSRGLRNTPYPERRGGRGFYLMDADGGNLREIAHFDSVFRGATWSPDGTHVAFGLAGDIMVIDRDGAGFRNLTNHPGSDYGPDWFDPRYSTAFTPAHRALFQWGWLKQFGQAQ